jgi:phage repressor protein C with HTH and peptisase S24 domain
MSALREARKAAGLTQAQLAELAGTSQPQIRRLEVGDRELTKAWAERLAPFVRTSPQALLFEAEPTDERRVIGVKGIISAGGSIETENEQLDPDGNLFEIEVPFAIPNDAWAFVVRGESMWPRYDPDDVVITYKPSENPRQLVGWEAAVQDVDGNRYLKKLLEAARPGHFDLESHNAAPIRNVRIAWASDIYGVVRAARWRRLDSAGKKRAIKKVMAG